MGSLHFSLGSELGKRLTEIAQEKLICELDIDGALNVYMHSLHGFSRDLAIRCISGKDLKLEVDEDEIVLTEREIPEYPAVDFKYHIRNWMKEYEETYKIFERPLLHHTNFTQRYITIPVSVRDIMIGYENCNDDPYTFMKSFLGNEIDYLEYCNSDFQKCATDIELCRLFRDWKTLALKRAKIIDFLYEHGFVGEDEHLISSRLQWQTTEYEQKLYNSIYIGIAAETEEWINNKDDLQKFLDAAQEIDKVEELKPILDYEFHNAIWISPDGTMYGLNGEIANMLHNTIADMLCQQGIIKPDNKREERNPYIILEEAGWVKVHNDWIMFEPNPFECPKRFMTPAQVEKISQYIYKHYKGVGHFGIAHNVIPCSLFRAMDQFAINKLFEY